MLLVNKIEKNKTKLLNLYLIKMQMNFLLKLLLLLILINNVSSFDNLKYNCKNNFKCINDKKVNKWDISIKKILIREFTQFFIMIFTRKE